MASTLAVLTRAVRSVPRTSTGGGGSATGGSRADVRARGRRALRGVRRAAAAATVTASAIGQGLGSDRLDRLPRGGQVGRRIERRVDSARRRVGRRHVRSTGLGVERRRV